MLTVENGSSSKRTLRWRCTLRRVAHLLVGCTLLSSADIVLAAQDSPSKVSDAVERVRQGNVGTGIVDASSYVDIIANAAAVQAIPSLKEWFGRSQDEEMKAELASALVRLRDPDNGYWDFLVRLAKPALGSDAPFPFDGSKEIHGVSPEFDAWAKAKAQDKGAVPLIIEACKKAPTDCAALADALIYFDAPRAESEFHHYFPDVDIHEAKQFRGSDP